MGMLGMGMHGDAGVAGAAICSAPRHVPAELRPNRMWVGIFLKHVSIRCV